MTKKIEYSYLEELFKEIEYKSKTASPDESYSAYLIGLGREAVGKKLVEEAFELAVANIEAGTFKDEKSEVISEAADVLYHMMALLISRGVDFKEVIAELKSRNKVANFDKILYNKEE